MFISVSLLVAGIIGFVNKLRGSSHSHYFTKEYLENTKYFPEIPLKIPKYLKVKRKTI